MELSRIIGISAQIMATLDESFGAGGSAVESHGFIGHGAPPQPAVDPNAVEHMTNTMALGAVTATAVWSPATHDDLLKKAFEGLSRADYDSMRFGSREVDASGGLIPVTLLERDAYKHAMTPGAKVREFKAKGLSQTDAVKAAQDWARQEAVKYVDDKGEQAKRLMRESEKAIDPMTKEGLRRQAFWAFGEGAHTLMDNTSPAHRDFQVYDVEPYAKKGVLRGGLDLLLDMQEHAKKEEQPTLQELNATINALQNYYKNVFGKAALQKAIPKGQPE